jgi:hypothetical protein
MHHGDLSRRSWPRAQDPRAECSKVGFACAGFGLVVRVFCFYPLDVNRGAYCFYPLDVNHGAYCVSKSLERSKTICQAYFTQKSHASMFLCANWLADVVATGETLISGAANASIRRWTLTETFIRICYMFMILQNGLLEFGKKKGSQTMVVAWGLRPNPLTT